MPPTDTRAASNKLWPRSTSLFLLFVGILLSVASFAVVINMPELPWEPARDSQLWATYEGYHETGALQVAEGAEPGGYILASLMGHLTGADSPYPGLSLLMAFLVAVPLLWLPTSVARIFRRARAGYALLLLPAVIWLLNQGTILVGTEYGLADSVSTLRVHALYGIAASLTFLSLALILHLSTYRLRWPTLVGSSVAVALLAAISGSVQSLSGVGVAAAIGVLWWLNSPPRWRWGTAVTVGAAAVALSFAAQTAVGNVVDADRSQATEVSGADRPGHEGFWQGLYLGLSYPEPITGEPSVLGIPSSVSAAGESVAQVDPAVQAGTDEYDAVLRDLYLERAAADPMETGGLYLAKALLVVKHFGGMIAFVVVSFVIALMRRSPQRRLLGASIAIAAPTFLVGLGFAVFGMPDLYHYAQLSAALGLLVAVSLGALVWSLTSMPSHVRSTERSRLSRRIPQRFAPLDERSHTSVVVPTRNGESVIEGTVRALAGVLRDGDEVVVVENGSSDATTEVLESVASDWQHSCSLVILHSGPGLGEALRTGVLATSGQWLLLTADDLPFGFTDLEQFEQLPSSVIVAVGSKAHPESRVERSRRRAIQSRVFRFLRAALLQSNVGDSQGTIWVDGDWARAFSLVSREMGLMWTTELVLAAEQQGIVVHEVPVSLSDAHEKGSSRFRFSDAWHSVVGFLRLAVYKDDYANEVWTRTPADTETASSRASNT